jgi:hypothetical protein
MKTKQIPNLPAHMIVVNMQSSFTLILLAANHAPMLLASCLLLVLSDRETKLMTQVSIFSFPFGESFTAFTVCG